jgi:hypothetical protein
MPKNWLTNPIKSNKILIDNFSMEKKSKNRNFLRDG